MSHRILKFLKTPKGRLTILLAILIDITAPLEKGHPALNLACAVVAAGLLDAVILRVRKKAWEFPSGAVLSAAIVVMVLRSQEPWYVPTVTSVVAILSKYALRSLGANVFNPAALAMVASYYLFHAGQSWWGAVPELPSVATFLLIAFGVYITNRVNKMPLVLSFLAGYFLLFGVTAYVADPLTVAEVFRAPDLQAVLYFAFFILTDPPTSPTRYGEQVVCGGIVALVACAAFQATGVVYYLLAGVLVGNGWEAWRRVSRRAARTLSPRMADA